METPKHVILFSYSPKLTEYVRYDALVIGARDLEGHDEPVLQTVHFRHDDTASHHALNGVDWADTFERTLDVPHQDDLENQSFYYIYQGEEDGQRELVLDAAASLIRQGRIESLEHENEQLRAQLAATTEGKDAALQMIADAGTGQTGTSTVIPINSVPASSLPSVDAPVIETKQYSDGSSATGLAPLPEQSPAQQDAQQEAFASATESEPLPSE